MIRQENMSFQIDRPVFVKYPFQSWGRVLQKGDEFKWKEIGVTEEVHFLVGSYVTYCREGVGTEAPTKVFYATAPLKK